MDSTLVMYTNESSDPEFNDGPYIFREDEGYRSIWFEKGKLIEQHLSSPEDEPRWNPEIFDSKYLFTKSRPTQDNTESWHGIKKLAALGDIHGQFELFVKILKNNGLLDASLRWAFGDGHLVVLGDVMDRGDRVTECLWLLYQLEQQAIEAGGRLHFLLGNHEEMVLKGDLRYLHVKYKHVGQLLSCSYHQMFGSNSILGSWLRNKPVLLSINQLLFVHAGISPALVSTGLTPDQCNARFRDRMYDISLASDSNNSGDEVLYGNDGPLWYRGYFFDRTFDQQQLRDQLSYFHKSHIVVGHTPMGRVKSFFNGGLLAVDSSIKYGLSGEILLVDNHRFEVGNEKGERRALWP